MRAAQCQCQHVYAALEVAVKSSFLWCATQCEVLKILNQESLVPPKQFLNAGNCLTDAVTAFLVADDVVHLAEFDNGLSYQ